jgi:hypothetical protein
MQERAAKMTRRNRVAFMAEIGGELDFVFSHFTDRGS